MQFNLGIGILPTAFMQSFETSGIRERTRDGGGYLMSLQFIGLFQKSLYEILNTDAELKNMIPRIYISVQQDAEYPFILLSFSCLNDVSKYSKKIYETEFEISVFTRDKLQDNVLKAADHISKLIMERPVGIGAGKLVSLRRNSLEWVRGNEIPGGKMVMKYMGRISS